MVKLFALLFLLGQTPGEAPVQVGHFVYGKETFTDVKQCEEFKVSQEGVQVIASLMFMIHAKGIEESKLYGAKFECLPIEDDGSI